MGRKYTVPYSGTITNAGGDSDLLELLPADDKPVKLIGFIISQISEVGDAAEEGVRISVILLPATVTSGSGGSSVTPAPPNSSDTAAGFAAECNNTTVATTSGSAVTRLEMGWNERNTPFDFIWPQDFEPVARQGEAIVIRMQTTLADDLTGQITAFVEEF